MKRNIIAAICVILSVTFIFVGCSKKNKIVKDDYGKTHIAYTDENGETVTNEYGDVYVLSTNELGSTETDENGEPKTVEARQRNIKIDSSGKKVETKNYTVEIPEGWNIRSDITNHTLIETADENDTAFMEIFCYYEDGLDAIKENVRQHQDDFADSVDDVIEDEEEETKLEVFGVDSATKYTFSGTKTVDGTKGEVKYCCYVFQKGNAVYSIYCGAKSTADFDKADFDSVISSVKFK